MIEEFFMSKSYTNKAEKQREHSDKPKLSLPATELIKICEKFDITAENYKNKKRNDFKQVVKEYFIYNKEFSNKMNPILNEVVTSLK